MKKIIRQFTSIITLLLILIIFYLSIFGVETEKFNDQISNNINGINKNLDIEINKIRITLEPFKLRIKAKTLGPKLRYKDKILGLESVKTQISINSLINKKFSISN